MYATIGRDNLVAIAENACYRSAIGEIIGAMFGTRATPNDCIARLNNALDEIAAIRDMLAMMPPGGGHQGNWDANRKRSQAHLADAWASVGWALRALWFGQRDRTRAEEIDASVNEYRRDMAVLRAEMKRLEGARGTATGDVDGFSPFPPANGASPDEVTQRLRRLIMGTLHPDKAADPAESEWRTALCQHLFPEIDRIVAGR